MSAAPACARRVPWAGVAASGLLGGALDLLFAFVFIGELFSHIFLFGIVIALGVGRAVTAAGRRP